MAKKKNTGTTAIRANVSIAHRDKFAQFCRDNGEVQHDVLGKLLDWFMSLDASARSVITDRLHEGDLAFVTAMALERSLQDSAPGLNEKLKQFYESRPAANYNFGLIFELLNSRIDDSEKHSTPPLKLQAAKPKGPRKKPKTKKPKG